MSDKPKDLWGLLKAYVKEFELANDAKFSDDAWQRIKQLDKDIREWSSHQEKKTYYYTWQLNNGKHMWIQNVGWIDRKRIAKIKRWVHAEGEFAESAEK